MTESFFGILVNSQFAHKHWTFSRRPRPLASVQSMFCLTDRPLLIIMLIFRSYYLNIFKTCHPKFGKYGYPSAVIFYLLD
jgi:hypothetical protein